MGPSQTDGTRKPSILLRKVENLRKVKMWRMVGSYLLLVTVTSALAALPAHAQDLTPTAMLGVDGLVDKANKMVQQLEETGSSWTRQWTDAIRSASNAVQTASENLRNGVTTAGAELRVAEQQLQLLLTRAEQAFANQRVCTRMDLQYLLATTDARLATLTYNNVPWNHSGSFVASGHAVGNPMHVGSTVGSTVLFDLEGSYPGFNRKCGTPAARIVPLILDGPSPSNLKPINIDVINATERDMQVMLPRISDSGIYNVQVAYATSSGLFSRCDGDWSYASWIVPVVARNREQVKVTYSVSPSCYYMAESGGHWDRELRSENCQERTDSVTLDEGCRFTSVGLELVTGDDMAHYELLDGNRRIVIHENSQCQECTSRVLGHCVDHRNHWGQHRFHAAYSCTKVTEKQLPAQTGTLGLAPGQAASVLLDPVKEVQAARDGQMCRWTLEAHLAHVLNGEVIRSDEATHSQPPSGQHPTQGSAASQWYQAGTPTAEVNQTLTAAGADWSLTWSPQTRRVSAMASQAVLKNCGLFE